MSIRRTLAMVGVLCAFALGAKAQVVGIKTNMLADVTLNPNLGVEFGLAKHWTLDASYEYNGWNIKNHKLKHYIISPEVRWWYCERFQGSFWGLHLLGGEFNVGNVDANIDFLGQNLKRLKDTRFEGWYLGAGIGYGYAWPVAKHWNIEFEVGVGWAYMKYDAYPACAVCGNKIESNAKHNYVGVTKLALSVEYLF